MVPLDLPVSKDRAARKDRLARKAFQVRPDHRVLTGSTASQDRLDRQEQQGRKARSVRAGCLVCLVKQDATARAWSKRSWLRAAGGSCPNAMPAT